MSTDRTAFGLRIGSDFGSNERTNERTDVEVGSGHLLTHGRTHGGAAGVSRGSASEQSHAASRGDEFTTIGDVIEAGHLWPTGERHPVIRSGERGAIPSHIRAAVWYRDAGRCRPCGEWQAEDATLHLDHIKPWSAGGPDTTDNLRLLCEYHNVERSNFVDFALPVRPATWWCLNCYDRDGFGWQYRGGMPICPRHTYRPARCRVMRRYERACATTGEMPTWHERDPITHADVIAYCAHCDAPALTDRPL